LPTALNIQTRFCAWGAKPAAFHVHPLQGRKGEEKEWEEMATVTVIISNDVSETMQDNNVIKFITEH